MFGKIKHIYFVGIGGAGMCGIAEILIDLGFKVSGSDKQLTDVTNHLKSIGATIYDGHFAKNVTGADALVYSSAVSMENPEVLEAQKMKIPIIRRAEMLGELMRMKFGISIAGTHGKTTTTSMAGEILTEGGLDPTIIVGGKLKKNQTNARLGQSKFLVAEADEFDRSFLTLTSSIAVITTLEVDHLDCYADLDDIKQAFVTFANKVPFFGAVIACIDEPSVQDILPELKRRTITYGVSKQADLQAINITYKQGKSSYTLVWHDEILGEITIKSPGLHNIKNSLAAIAIGIELEMKFDSIKHGIESFDGVGRRFEVKGIEKDIMVVDDYAHHPTEIMASLQGAKSGWDRRIVAVFQPHLYSRTRDFYQEFGKSFFNSDILVVTDVYPAREEPISGVSGELISKAATEFGHRRVEYVADKKKIVDFLKKEMHEGDLLITMGAGDIHKYGQEFLDSFKRVGMTKTSYNNSVLKGLNGDFHFDFEVAEKAHYRIGGKVDIYAIPETREDCRLLIERCKENDIPYFVFGEGTNLLISDNGYRGVFLSLEKACSELILSQEKSQIGAGVVLWDLIKATMENGLGDMSNMSWIPGTVGGALFMNAGAFGTEIEEFVISVDVIDENGQFRTLNKEEAAFAYRTSGLQSGYTILGAQMKFKNFSVEEMKINSADIIAKRQSRQPLDYPSCGSVFKRPPGLYAGTLIEDCQLKGYRFGGAQVSEKHANFILNVDQAKAEDVYSVIKHVVKTVFDIKQVRLEREVKLVGFEDVAI